MTKIERVERYIATIETPTLILVDAGFLEQEFRINRKFYSELYSGEKPEMPRKEFTDFLHPRLLFGALCKYGNGREQMSIPVIFQQRDDFNIVAMGPDKLFRTVRCSDPTWDEMRKVILACSEFKRVIIMGDDEGYLPLLGELMERDYDICLIKHKQENENDWSRMPGDLTFQFSYYVIGEAMGLTREEL